jgi:hypothetical protein
LLKNLLIGTKPSLLSPLIENIVLVITDPFVVATESLKMQEIAIEVLIVLLSSLVGKNKEIVEHFFLLKGRLTTLKNIKTKCFQVFLFNLFKTELHEKCCVGLFLLSSLDSNFDDNDKNFLLKNNNNNNNNDNNNNIDTYLNSVFLSVNNNNDNYSTYENQINIFSQKNKLKNGNMETLYENLSIEIYDKMLKNNFFDDDNTTDTDDDDFDVNSFENILFVRLIQNPVLVIQKNEIYLEKTIVFLCKKILNNSKKNNLVSNNDQPNHIAFYFSNLLNFVLSSVFFNDNVVNNNNDEKNNDNHDDDDNDDASNFENVIRKNDTNKNFYFYYYLFPELFEKIKKNEKNSHIENKINLKTDVKVKYFNKKQSFETIKKLKQNTCKILNKNFDLIFETFVVNNFFNRTQELQKNRLKFLSFLCINNNNNDKKNINKNDEDKDDNNCTILKNEKLINNFYFLLKFVFSSTIQPANTFEIRFLTIHLISILLKKIVVFNGFNAQKVKSFKYWQTIHDNLLLVSNNNANSNDNDEKNIINSNNNNYNSDSKISLEKILFAKLIAQKAVFYSLELLNDVNFDIQFVALESIYVSISLFLSNDEIFLLKKIAADANLNDVPKSFYNSFLKLLTSLDFDDKKDNNNNYNNNNNNNKNKNSNNLLILEELINAKNSFFNYSEITTILLKNAIINLPINYYDDYDDDNNDQKKNGKLENKTVTTTTATKKNETILIEKFDFVLRIVATLDVDEFEKIVRIECEQFEKKNNNVFLNINNDDVNDEDEEVEIQKHNEKNEKHFIVQKNVMQFFSELLSHCEVLKQFS